MGAIPADIDIHAEIERLRTERNAIILAHYYQEDEIQDLADFIGDSLQLAKAARDTEADVILFCGVHFMAETSKILSPQKTVLIPDYRAGCSLAESITPDDIAELRRQHPGAPVCTYVNTSAAVKAASDITCTSSNAVDVVKSLGTDKVICLPDQYLASWIQSQLPEIEIVTHPGACEVHERFTGPQLARYRTTHAGVPIIAHPECPPDVLAEADFVGSTSAMTRWVTENQPAQVVMVTECSMADNVAQDAPNTEFLRPCNMCPHMKRITIHNIRTALEEMQYEVRVDAAVAEQAKAAVDAMLAVGPPKR